MSERRELLRRSAAFQGLDDAQLARIEALGEPVELEPGQLLLEEDQGGGRCFFLLEGKVEVEVRAPFAGREPQRLATIPAGELVGELSLVDGHLRSASARAVETGRALAFDGERLLALLAAEPAIGFVVMRNVARQLAQRIRSSNTKLRQALMDVLYY